MKTQFLLLRAAQRRAMKAERGVERARGGLRTTALITTLFFVESPVDSSAPELHLEH